MEWSERGFYTKPGLVSLCKSLTPVIRRDPLFAAVAKLTLFTSFSCKRFEVMSIPWSVLSTYSLSHKREPKFDFAPIMHDSFCHTRSVYIPLASCFATQMLCQL